MTYQHFSNDLFLIFTKRDSLKNKLNAFFRFIILMIFITACAKKDSETKNNNTTQKNNDTTKQESVKFVVVGGSGTILTSLDGNSWSSENSGTSNLLSDVIYTNGILISIGGVFVDNVSTVLKHVKPIFDPTWKSELVHCSREGPAAGGRSPLD